MTGAARRAPVGPARVADLLADPLLAEAGIVAGTSGLEGVVRDVRWYDGDLTDLDRCLLVCPDNEVTPPYRLDALVRRAKEHGAAGVLVVGPRTRSLLSTLRLADRLALPVLWVDHRSPVRLVQDLTALVRAPAQLRTQAVERLLRRLSAKRSGPEILGAASTVLEAPLSLVADDGTVLLGAPAALDDVRLDQAVPQRGARVLVHPVLDPTVNRVAAWVACAVERAAPARLDVLATGLAVTEPFLRSWLAGQRAQSDRDDAFQARLLAEVMAAGDSVGRDVVEGAVSLGWRLSDWHIGIHLYSPSAPAPGGREPLVTAVGAALTEHGFEVVTAVYTGVGWAMWTSADREPAPDWGRQALRTFRVVAAGLPREWALVLGIGRPHRGPAGLAATLIEARDAADLARSHDFRPAVEHADELGVARLLGTWQRSEVTRAFAETALAPLREAPVLLTTLRAYLESGGSVTEAAAALGVHRNTIASRLSVIKERIGADLTDPSQRLAFQVACRALTP
ncbi:helix-turn-helix domain-containing protein [Intrasporangium sp.]|uniref:helix-turn-helix domain-containing protein n=1 Tax=Intrasporangium sp. TaxID=1925024 RepID=UPI003221FDDA